MANIEDIRRRVAVASSLPGLLHAKVDKTLRKNASD